MNDYLILSTMKEKCQGEKTGNYQAYTLPETPVNRHSLSNHSDLIVLSIRSFGVLKYLHMRRDLQDSQKSLWLWQPVATAEVTTRKTRAVSND